MKKTIFTLLAASAVYVLVGAKTLTINPIATAPTIDGNGDDDWAGISFVDMTENKGEAANKNNTAKFKLTYDQKFFYVFASVEDATLDTAQSPNVWEKDCIEVFFCMDTANAAAYRTGDAQLRKVYGRDLTDQVAKGYKAVEEATATGFTQEWQLSIDSLCSDGKGGAKAKFDGTNIRFEIQNGDNDGSGRNSQIFWNANTDDAWNSVKNQGYVVLSVPVGVKNVAVQSSISVKSNSIEFANTSDVNVYDITGKLVIKANNVNSISTAALKSGVYVVKANNEAKKFIK